MKIFRAKYFSDHVQEQKERKFAKLVQGALLVAGYETRFSILERYAPYIFDNLCRKLKKFINGLWDNIRRYVTTNDPKIFTRTLRIAHVAEIENNKFMTKHKSVANRPETASASTSTHRQKDK